MLIGMLLEVLGIGLIIPLFSIITDQNFVEKYPMLTIFLTKLYPANWFSDFSLFKPEQNQLIIIAVILVVLVYFFKSAFLIYLSWKQANFIKELNKHSQLNTKLYISFIELSDNIYLPRGSYMRRIEPETIYQDKLIKDTISYWTKTYYTFRHLERIKEPMINCESFKRLMKTFGWKYTKEFKYKDIKSNWKDLFKYIKRIEFTKI